MKKINLIISIYLLVLSACSLVSAQSHQLADEYLNKADELAKQGKYLEAAKMFEKTVQAEKASPSPRMTGLAVGLSQAGYFFNTVDQYDKAIKYYDEALAIYRKQGEEDSVIDLLTEISMSFQSLGQHDKAIKYSDEALGIYRKLGQEDYVAILLTEIGISFQSLGQHDKAIKYCDEALGIDRKLGEEDSVATQLTIIGVSYHSLGQHDKAIKYSDEALAISKRLGLDEGITTCLTNIGEVYHSLGQYDKALKSYEESLIINKKSGREADIAGARNNIGCVYRSWGQYDKALKFLEESLVINKKFKMDTDIAKNLNNIGAVYRLWGQYDNAIKYYEESLVINNKLKSEPDIARSLNNIGEVYVATVRISEVYNTSEQYDKAIKYFEESLVINKKLGRKADVAKNLINIATVYKSSGQFVKALKCLVEALGISRELGYEDDVATVLNNIGELDLSLSKYDKALKLFEGALVIEKKLGSKAGIATTLNNIGVVYYKQKKNEVAIKNFIEAVSIKEKLRKTATGDIRRDYLASQLNSYQWLTRAYINDLDISSAFQIIELGRAKLLAERLTGDESKIELSEIKQIQETLDDDTTIIIFANVSLENIIQIAITREEVAGKEVSNKSFVQSAIDEFDTPIKTLLSNQRGKNETKNRFDKIINYYRSLLKREKDLKKEFKESLEIRVANTRKLGKGLYELLIKPMEAKIKGKKNLIIVTDGILAFVPFETLLDEDGKYLVENYHISYIQSIGVHKLIKERKYSEDRKPLLAFGGAVYDKVSYNNVDMIKNDKQLGFLKNNIKADIENNRSLRNAYVKLGIGSWPSLPATLSEVNSIESVIKRSDIVTERDVTEKGVKELSRNGKLSNYKVLHFATHGLVVPEIPELSALVLSQFKDEQGKEDGYLRMGEIVKLEIKADFVNLSACETGLGKIYRGEGIVGLTQSFLLAGANAVSVSLWSVADESTSQFMVSMYGMVQNKHLSYANAITEVKRQFINGNFGVIYKEPYYWAPFVFYGN